VNQILKESRADRHSVAQHQHEEGVVSRTLHRVSSKLSSLLHKHE
jgi:hypothetical protein